MSLVLTDVGLCHAYNAAPFYDMYRPGNEYAGYFARLFRGRGDKGTVFIGSELNCVVIDIEWNALLKVDY